MKASSRISRRELLTPRPAPTRSRPIAFYAECAAQPLQVLSCPGRAGVPLPTLACASGFDHTCNCPAPCLHRWHCAFSTGPHDSVRLDVSTAPADGPVVVARAPTLQHSTSAPSRLRRLLITASDFSVVPRRHEPSNHEPFGRRFVHGTYGHVIDLNTVQYEYSSGRNTTTVVGCVCTHGPPLSSGLLH